MNNLKFVKCKCVVRNLSKKVVRMLGQATLNPDGAPVDLFAVIPNLSEITVIDALRDPDGEIYSKVKQGVIEIISCDLVMFNNTSVPYTMVAPPPKEDIVVKQPLVLKDGVLSINNANEYNDGVLTKENYLSFKDSSSKLCVWQYQDVDFDGMLNTIYSFNSFDFNASIIVNNSAVVTDAKNNIIEERSMFGFGKPKPLLVKQHLGDKVVLEKGYKGPLRIWFMVCVHPALIVAESDIPIVPDAVRALRADTLDSYLVDSKAGQVLGAKKFSAPVEMNTIKVTESAEVQGGITTDKIMLKDGAFSGAILTSRALGDAVWSHLPVVSDDVPVGDAANLWFNTKLYGLFVKVNGSWVSTESQHVKFGGGSGLSNCYLANDDGQLSIVKPYDFIITEASFSAAKGGLFAFELHNDSTKIPNATIECHEGLGTTNINLGIRVSAGVPLRVFLNGSNIHDPRVKLKIKAII